jgi:hypothetical protein
MVNDLVTCIFRCCRYRGGFVESDDSLGQCPADILRLKLYSRTSRTDRLIKFTTVTSLRIVGSSSISDGASLLRGITRSLTFMNLMTSCNYIFSRNAVHANAFLKIVKKDERLKINFCINWHSRNKVHAFILTRAILLLLAKASCVQYC